MNIYELAAVRTNNFAQDMGEKIGGLWQEVMSTLEHKTTIYAVYHEYESDYSGDYTLSLATKSQESSRLITLDDGNYQVFEVEGPSEADPTKNVFSTWQEIWALERDGQLNRRYQTDYEKYDEDGRVAIYIGIE